MQGIFVFIPSSRCFSLTCLVGFVWILRGSTVSEDAGIEPDCCDLGIDSQTLSPTFFINSFTLLIIISKCFWVLKCIYQNKNKNNRFQDSYVYSKLWIFMNQKRIWSMEKLVFCKYCQSQFDFTSRLENLSPLMLIWALLVDHEVSIYRKLLVLLLLPAK